MMLAPAELLPPPGSRWRALRGLLGAACALLALAASAAWFTYWVSLNSAMRDLQDAAVRRLDSVAAALDSALARFDYLPALLETTPAVMDLLARPGDPTLRDQANRTLVRINAIAGADMLFVLDAGGDARAAADWDQPAITTLGHNYSYRPYMKDALASGRGRFFGVGATSRIPGYFLSYALKGNDRTLGVATVKVNLDAAERVWATLPGDMLVSDERGVVILSSRPAWRFQALRPLTAEERAVVAEEKPYTTDPVVLPWAGDGALQTGQHVVVDGAVHLVTARALPTQRWQMQALAPMAPAYGRARNQALMAALAAAVAGLLLMAAWQSRRNGMQKLATQAALQAAHDTLETRVAERTRQLSDANTSLAAEIETRKAVEQSLHATQAELVHAAKMAVLGQLSAGLAHELNQPLAALRTLSDNAVVLMDKERLPETRGNLERISHLVGRLGELTRRLKTFAHKPGDALVPTPLGTAVANAQGLLADRLKRLGVAFEVQIGPEGLCALADPGLVEQVLVNLMVNALDAMAATDPATKPRRLRVVASLQHGAQGGRVQLQVQDNGPGVAPAMRAHLFEPFATSKPAGAGLGLGLMISQRIVRSFGGELGLCDATEPGLGGACFCIDVPACTATPNTP